ncbi:MAG: aspartate-semialdehyde dehydrogenase [Ignavibacteria bacterium]|jgi:aspartate-semialdehyde dehydrogenase
MGFKMAIVGATGLVGRTMLDVLDEMDVPIDSLALYASERSAGTMLEFRGTTLTVQKLNEHSFDAIDIALFSAGGVLSRAYAPIAVKAGCTVIDNSSAFRMEPNVPLVVPEVNPDDAMNHHGIIANPNCSTIQLVLALEPIRKRFGLNRLILSTYQSVSGAGQKGIDQLHDELQGIEPQERISPHPLAFNTVFHNRIHEERGASTEEEIKMRREIRRIFSMPDLPIAVTCVRIPTTGGHAESVYAELDAHWTIDDIHECLSDIPGLTIIDDSQNDAFPTPISVAGNNNVFVGRIRKDEDHPQGLMIWVVADNLRKGAATNAVQIAELLMKKNS